MSRSSSGGSDWERASRAFNRWYDCAGLAARGVRFEGRLPLAGFTRLRGALATADGTIHAGLRFEREGGCVMVRGWCRGELPLVCQRCLETYPHPVAVEISMMAVESEGLLGEVPEAYEAVLIEERIRPLDLIEDELSLALPLVPAHPDRRDCVDLGPWDADRGS